MHLENATLKTLEFEPHTSILKVNWADLENAGQDEKKEAITELCQTLRLLSIQHLLIDGSSCGPDMNTTRLRFEYKQLLLFLAGTPVNKLARIRSKWPEREAQTAAMEAADCESASHILAFRNFDAEPAAMAWLQADEAVS